jgi:hypothetical protein
MSRLPYNPTKVSEKNRLRRAAAREYLGGKCAKCGETEGLEFDHIDASTKSFRICHGLEYSWERLAKELDLCQLLCKPCHYAKSRDERGHKEQTHGTASRYNNKGCRCTDCRAAWTVYCRERRKHYGQKHSVGG